MNSSTRIIYNLDKYNHSIQVVIGNKLIILETSDDILNLKGKKIRSIWVRTIIDLHTTDLDISNNLLTFFPDIFSLKRLNCSNCRIKEMPTIMPKLEELNCSNNLIQNLPNYPKLEILDCSDNPIITLPLVDRITANNCPITTLYFNPTYYQRSGIILRGKFQWIQNKTIEHRYVILNWQNAKTTILFVNAFSKKLSKFLFYT